MIQNTWLALLPVLTVLVVSVTTKRALLGLLAGTVVGTILIGGWGFFDTLVAPFGTSLSTETVHWLVMEGTYHQFSDPAGNRAFARFF